MAMQDSFEDAPENTPRPDSHSEQSRSRSLLGKRESSSSTAHDARSSSPAPSLPEVPKEANDDADKPKTASDVPGKSPLLTAHRISVTSDMDDVSLDEGTSKPPFQGAHGGWCECSECSAHCSPPHTHNQSLSTCLFHAWLSRNYCYTNEDSRC